MSKLSNEQVIKLLGQETSKFGNEQVIKRASCQLAIYQISKLLN